MWRRSEVRAAACAVWRAAHVRTDAGRCRCVARARRVSPVSRALGHCRLAPGVEVTGYALVEEACRAAAAGDDYDLFEKVKWAPLPGASLVPPPEGAADGTHSDMPCVASGMCGVWCAVVGVRSVQLGGWMQAHDVQ